MKYEIPMTFFVDANNQSEADKYARQIQQIVDCQLEFKELFCALLDSEIGDITEDEEELDE